MSNIGGVIKSISIKVNQKEHHRKITFKEEYMKFLNKFEIEHEEKFLFEWYNDEYNAESTNGL